MSLKSRMERFGLREDRADVILPACFVYHRIAELNGSEEILVPRVSLKDGVVQEILEQAKGTEHLLDLREQVGVSCREMVARYKLDQRHAEKVADLALSLFDQTESLHGLGKRERIYLEAAALLHDIGYFISMQKHHKHSHYIIANSEIVGLAPAERLLVAESPATTGRPPRTRRPTRSSRRFPRRTRPPCGPSPPSSGSPTRWTRSTPRPSGPSTAGSRTGRCRSGAEPEVVPPGGARRDRQRADVPRPFRRRRGADHPAGGVTGCRNRGSRTRLPES